jgi:hypothetical protein
MEESSRLYTKEIRVIKRIELVEPSTPSIVSTDTSPLRA